MSLQGHFLIASPHLSDVNFFRSVVLMLKHDDEGALGVILNRPTNNTVAGVWKLVGFPDCKCEKPIYLGGPVSGPLMAVHTSKFLAHGEVMPGLYFTSTKEALNKLAAKPDRKFRIFSGYSGWGAGQLESELEAGGWLISTATVPYVFDDADDVWEKLIRLIGREVLGPRLAKGKIPEDPSLN